MSLRETALLEENTRLKETNNHLKEQNHELTSVISSKEQTISAQQNRLNDLLKRIYGRRSEKFDPNQLVFDEVILSAEKSVRPGQEALDEEVKEQVIREHIRRSHPGRRPLPEHLKRIEHYLDINEKDKVTKEGKERPLIGFDINERLDYQPCTFVVHRYVRPKYGADDDIEGVGVKQMHGRKRPVSAYHYRKI
jgi:transposase